MNWNLLLVLCAAVYWVIIGSDTCNAAKRIKRNYDLNGNRSVSGDFALVSDDTDRAMKLPESAIDNNEGIAVNEKKVLDKRLTKLMSKEPVSLYESMLQSQKSPSTQTRSLHPNHPSTTPPTATALENRKHTPMTYVFRGQQHSIPEYVTNHIVAAAAEKPKDDKVAERPAEVVIIDNTGSSSPLLKDLNGFYTHFHGEYPNQLSTVDHGRIEGDSKYMLKGLSHVLNMPRGGEHNGAYNVVPNHLMAEMPTDNDLPSIHRMFKLANMLMHKIENGAGVGNEVYPIRTQSTQLSFMPLNTHNQLEVISDDPDAIDYVFNVIGGPADAFNSMATKMNMQQLDTYPQQQSALHRSAPVTHDAALFFKQPIEATDNRVVNLIENALDTLLANSNEVDRNDEVEVRCPIHHQSKHLAGEVEGAALTDGNAAKDNEVIQVCSCHFVKKKKADDEITSVKTQ